MENQENITAVVEQPIKKQRVHRVGTFTMGIALVITGIVLCALVFVPYTDVLIVAKLSPLLLVALGCEVVVFTLTSKETKLKYDFLSILMCLFIIFGAVSATLLPTLFEYLGPARAQLEQNISTDVINQFKNEKDKYPQLYTVSASIGINGLRTFTQTDSFNVLTPADWLYVYAEFNSTDSKEQFAKDTIDVYKKLSSMSQARIQLTCTSTASNNKPYYSVDFRGTFINEPTVDSIMQRMETYVFNSDNNSYLTERDYNVYFADKAQREEEERAERLQDNSATAQGDASMAQDDASMAQDNSSTAQDNSSTASTSAPAA